MEHYKKRLEIRPKVKEIAENIALAHGVTMDELFGRSQKARIVQARVAFWRSLRDMGWSLPDIGEMSDRCHATVMYGLRSHDGERAQRVANVAARQERDRGRQLRRTA
jgi:chromosomal replication initiation ATPase DnaA